MDVSIIKEIYNNYYQMTQKFSEDHRLNSIGWNCSFTGQPYSKEEMREWRDDTAKILLSFAPESVLEVACGTGMILFSILSHINRYVGLDVAEAGIQFIKNELTEQEKKKVSLYEKEANKLSMIPDTAFDLALINSATQYMGPANTFQSYIKMMIDKVGYGGKIFLGDMKSKTFQEYFYRSVESFEHPETVAEKKIQRRKKFDFEFYIDKKYLNGLKGKFERVKKIDIYAKRGSNPTEMNLFRFDAALYLDVAPVRSYVELDGFGKQLSELEELIQQHPSAPLHMKKIKNKLLYECVMKKYEEESVETSEPLLYIEDVCKLFEKYGYQVFATPFENELDEYFDVYAWKED